MNRSFALTTITVLAGAAVLRAQDANPISANMKQSWQNVKGLLQRMAEKMPEENYGFKPTPEMQSFAQRMGHVISFNMRGCSAVKGEPMALTFPATASKADILGAMKQTNDVCDAAFNALTDAELVKPVVTGRGAPRRKIELLQGTVLEHSQEVYGYTAVYLRLKGIVPPSSDRNER